MWKGYCSESDITLYKNVYGPFKGGRYYSFFMFLNVDLCTNEYDIDSSTIVKISFFLKRTVKVIIPS